MIGTRILKIAEIIEVKIGTRHLEINILLLQRGRKTTSIISAISESIFKIHVLIIM